LLFEANARSVDSIP